MPRKPWGPELRKKHGLKPGLSTRQKIKAKREKRLKAKEQGAATSPAVHVPPTPTPRPALPPSPTETEDIFFTSSQPDTDPGDMLGEELDPEPPAEETASTSTTTTQDPELESVEDYFTDEEIQEIFEMLWEDGGNFLLRKLKRELITKHEAQKLGKLSFKVFKKRLGGKLQTLPETALLVYAALTLFSKDKVGEGPRPASTTETAKGKEPEYIPPSPAAQTLLTPEEAANAARRQPL